MYLHRTAAPPAEVCVIKLPGFCHVHRLVHELKLITYHGRWNWSYTIVKIFFQSNILRKYNWVHTIEISKRSSKMFSVWQILLPWYLNFDRLSCDQCFGLYWINPHNIMKISVRQMDQELLFTKRWYIIQMGVMLHLGRLLLSVS